VHIKFVAELVARCTCGGRRFAERYIESGRARDGLLDVACRWEGAKACPFCGKPYRSSFSLRDHLLSEHREQVSAIQTEMVARVLPRGERRLHEQPVEVAVQCSKCGSVVARGRVNARSWNGFVGLGRLLEELGVGESCPSCGAKLPRKPKKLLFMPSKAQAGVESAEKGAHAIPS